MSVMPGGDRVDSARSGVKLTYDDFVLFPDDGKRHELIDGEHYVTPSPNVRHQQISGNLHLLIGTWLEQHPSGKVFYAPLDVILSNFDVVEPDLLYISNERAAQNEGRTHVQVVPELVIEIASHGTRKRDETIKWRLYERAGVTEYWVIDPDVDVVRVYRRDGDAFDRARELSRERNDVLTTDLLPGLELQLGRIFRD
jgi:Uma2 family endonuclease